MRICSYPCMLDPSENSKIGQTKNVFLLAMQESLGLLAKSWGGNKKRNWLKTCQS